VYFVQFVWVFYRWFIAYRDKKLSAGVFVRFRAATSAPLVISELRCFFFVFFMK
jgi:hypothetical protein